MHTKVTKVCQSTLTAYLPVLFASTVMLCTWHEKEIWSESPVSSCTKSHGTLTCLENKLTNKQSSNSKILLSPKTIELNNHLTLFFAYQFWFGINYVSKNQIWWKWSSESDLLVCFSAFKSRSSCLELKMIAEGSTCFRTETKNWHQSAWIEVCTYVIYAYSTNQLINQD